MAIALDDLVEELELSFTGLTEEQMYAAVKRAVRAFSKKVSMQRRYTLNIVKGTAAYTLPDDFVGFIRFESTLTADGIYVQPGGGLVPLNDKGLPGQYSITGKTITFLPTPDYSVTYYLWYRAGHVLNEDQVYPYLEDEVMDIVLLKAQAEALRFVNAGSVGDNWKYQFGDVMIDKSNLNNSVQSVISNLNTEFDRLVADYTGPIGTQASYPTYLSEEI